jgi:hypothetical protein
LVRFGGDLSSHSYRVYDLGVALPAGSTTACSLASP